jgi:hypothetical protein
MTGKSSYRVYVAEEILRLLEQPLGPASEAQPPIS